MSKSKQQPGMGLPSAVARAALEHSGAGAHGGDKHQKNRRERKKAKQQLRQDPEA